MIVGEAFAALVVMTVFWVGLYIVKEVVLCAACGIIHAVHDIQEMVGWKK